jgi:hypothetical protein
MQSPPRERDELTNLRQALPPVCAECDYSLIGLPPGSRCPECGAPSDANLITIFGWGRGSQASVATMRPRDVVVTMIVVGAICAWWTFEYFEGRGHRFPTAFIVIYAAWFVTLLMRRWMLVPAGSAAPMRLRLSPAGFEQRLGPGPLKLTPWHRDMLTDLEIGGTTRHTLGVRWRAFSFHFSSTLIGIEFDSDPQIARQVRSLIVQWIDAASAPL